MYSGRLSHLAGLEVLLSAPEPGNGSVEQTGSFSLNPGVVIVEFRYDGPGDFKVELVTESDVQAPPATLGFGMLLLNALGWVRSEMVGSWLAFESRGRLLLLNMCALPFGGECFLRVHATDGWECLIFQPFAGQARSTFGQAPLCSGSAGQSVLGPFASSSNRLQCSTRLARAANMDLSAFSLDGNSETVIFHGHGSEGSMEHYAELTPEAEYLVLVNCAGDWEITFTED